MELTTLEAIEQLKQLKARYFRLMDQKRWDEWREVFTEDVTAVYHGVPGSRRSDELTQIQCHGRADLVAKVSRFLAKGISVHHGHMPEIEVTSPTTARGIWAMVDYLRLPSFTLKGYGHYEEEYVKEAGLWKIKTILLTRLHCDVTWEQTEGANGCRAAAKVWRSTWGVTCWVNFAQREGRCDRTQEETLSREPKAAQNFPKWPEPAVFEHFKP